MWIIVCEAINTFYFYKFFETLEQINSTSRLHGSNPLGIYQLRLNNKDIRTAYMFTCKRYLPTENKHSSKLLFPHFPYIKKSFQEHKRKVLTYLNIVCLNLEKLKFLLDCFMLLVSSDLYLPSENIRVPQVF